MLVYPPVCLNHLCRAAEKEQSRLESTTGSGVEIIMLSVLVAPARSIYVSMSPQSILTLLTPKPGSAHEPVIPRSFTRVIQLADSR